MPDIDAVALAALIISIIALTSTIGQLLQQYFATADGYRRCLPSVMGRWGTKSERRWRWREFRFETIYYVPHISLHKLTSFGGDTVSLSKIWDEDWRGTRHLNREYLLENDEFHNDSWGSGEMVCWVTFVKRLAQSEQSLAQAFRPLSQHPREWIKWESRSGSVPSVPSIRVLRRSWDFMPPDVTRPLCRTTLADIAILALRLGMKWKEFDPPNGKLRAEGPQGIITSRFIRSIGLCLEYTDTEHDGTLGATVPRKLDRILLDSFLPVDDVSYFLFGIVRGNPRLACYDRRIDSPASITHFLDFLDSTSATPLHLSANLAKAMKQREGWMPGFGDIIPITAPKLSSAESLLCRIPMPNSYAPGVLRSKEGQQVFCARLRDMHTATGASSQQLAKIMLHLDILERDHHDFWTAGDEVWGTIRLDEHISDLANAAFRAKEAYSRTVHIILDEMEDYLIGINVDPRGSIRGYKKELRRGFCYDTLLVEHIRMAVDSYEAAIEKLIIPPSEWRGLSGGRRDWLAACMNEYWDRLDVVCAAVSEYTDAPRELIIDAWVSMIFRAFCWHHCHSLVPTGMNLNPEWHRNRMPVYLG
ncbi:hypothetical protein QBC40DRAFT_229118 [Triangularia verruculosa]|uniref:Uncharacterized protein n=1 Tax=Triangularia verruculosa TaxID=2587418 RepID=A0AAN7ATU7_9PEZI|nr:hypothetical protein QBC40DRAFT_229118 [Triangularia verruculosa]